MGMNTLDPWLAECVWHELAAVVTWQREMNNGIKADPESRFQDDGSNFRSTVAGQEHSLVQLIEVLSAVEPVKVILSDGVTKVKAHLSNEVVAILEKEADESFSSEVTGDVLQLRTFTVISTVFGPADDFVQLAVDHVEYEHHLRKVQGEPRPVEEDENVQLLIQDITNLRCPPAVEEQTNVDTSSDRDPPHPTNGLTPTLVPSTQSQFLPSGIQSQYPGSRKRQSGPTLDNEGFQVAEGLNLHKPLRPTSGSPASKGPQAVTTGKAEVLLCLLGQKEAADESPPPSPQFEIGQRRAREVSLPTPILPSHSPPAHQKSSAVVAETPARVTHHPVEVLCDSDPEPEEPPRPQLSRHVAPPASNRSPPSAQPPPQVSSVNSSGSSGQPRIPYGRRKVPANQQKLLDDKSCWIPSQPGYRFPHPNVPIELLTKWNKTATPSPRKPRATQDDAARSIRRPKSPLDISMDDEDAHSCAMSSDDSSDSEDEEFNSEEWPPSSPLRRPELPPDSSCENDDVIRGTQHDDLEIAMPRALPMRKSPTRPAARSEQPPMRHALPPRPPVSISGQAAMDSVSSPPSSHGPATQQSRRPDSSFNAPRPVASTPSRQAGGVREAVRATPVRAQQSSQLFDARHSGSPASAQDAARTAVSTSGDEAATQDTSRSALKPGIQRASPLGSPASTQGMKRIEDDRDYLQPAFDPWGLSLSQLREILIAHNVAFPTRAELSHLIALFKWKVAPPVRRPWSDGMRHNKSTRPFVDGQDSPVSSRALQGALHTTPRAEDNEHADGTLDPNLAIDTLETPQLRRLLIAHDIDFPRSAKREELMKLFREGRDVQLQQELAKTRLKLAKAQEKKRRRAGSDEQAQANQDSPTSGMASPDTPVVDQSPPRSSFRNPAMVGRRSPTVQSSPLATPLRRPVTRPGAVNGSRDSPGSPVFTHEDADSTPRPTVSPPILSGRGCPPMSAEVSQPRTVPQARHPDEIHRFTRRDHFGRSGHREKWINDNFKRVNHGNKTIASMFALYKEQHPEDNITDLDKITRAAQIVFRSSREALARAKFRRINLPTVPAPVMVDSWPDTRPSPQSRSSPWQRNRTDLTSLQSGRTSERAASNSSPRGDRRSKAAPITQIDGADDWAHDAVSHAHISLAADNHHRSALDERVAETMTSEHTSDALREFCQNWLSIRPGGAFAISQPAPPNVRRTVDVLKWDV